MKNSHLIQVFRTFSKQEIKELGEFISSPFFNKHKGVISLYDYLKKHYPVFPDNKILKERAYSKIFPGDKYNDGYMRKVMFSLTRLAEEYLMYKGFSANKQAAADVLLQEYYSRSSPALFKKTYKEISEQKGNRHISPEQFYYSYLSSYRNLAFGAEHKTVDFAKFAGANDLFEPLEYLSAHYYSCIMNLYEYYLNTVRILNIEIDYAYFEKILDTFDDEILNKYPLLKIHFGMIKMLREPSKEGYFFETKNLLTENEEGLGQLELENIYINLQNYCMRKIRANRQEYSKELFEIYRLELARDVYSPHRPISVILYRNVIFTALQIKEIEFAESFAEKYRLMLPKENGEQNYLYAKAHIALKQKDFEKIAVYLSRIKSPDELLKADVKAMQLPMYYETGAAEQFYSLIDTFRHYLKSNQKLSDERKKLYETFIGFCVRLMALKAEPVKFKLGKLKEEIQKGENIINKGWLLEKITELEK